MGIQFIYLRNYGGQPVGCVAYQSKGNNIFAYGVSFLNSEADSINKKLSREVALGRLDLAVAGIKRSNSFGRFGVLPVEGDTINKKVVSLLQGIAAQELHNSRLIRTRMRVDLNYTAMGLAASSGKKVA